MSAGVNKVTILGNLGADPEVRYTQSGTAVCSFRVATQESWTKDGQKQEKTEWHKVIAWAKLGEICGEYLAKGRQVYIEGKIQTRQWDDKDGNKRYTTEIVARDVQFLGSRDGQSKGQQQQQQAPRQDPPQQRQDPPPRRQDSQQDMDFGPPPLGDEEIPF